jgi:hypothetical protein
MTLLEKLASIRRNIEAVEKQPSADGDDFTFAPANLVFDVVRDQLRRRKVLAFPYEVEELSGNRVRMTVRFVDQENDLDEQLVAWVGEADKGGGAATNAFKGALMATFLIEAVEPADLSRREARQAAVRRNGIASAAQLRHRVRSPGIKKGLHEAELLEMANLMLPSEHQITELDNLPKRLVDPLNERIKAWEPEAVTA